MVARLVYSLAKERFNKSWTAVGQARAKSQRNGKKKTSARFSPVSLKAKHWARRSRFWCATKTRGQRTTRRSQRNSGPHTPTSLMKPSMEFETGKAVAAHRRGRRLAEEQAAELQKKYCRCCT